MMHMERVEVDAHTMYIPLRIGNRIRVRMDIFSSSYFLSNIWRPSTFLCTYGKKLYMGLGMLIKMRTIGLDIQSALLKRVVFCGKS